MLAPTDLPSLEDDLRRDAEAVAEAGAVAARAAGFQVADTPVRRSQPEWRAATDLAEELNAAALVVGARGRSAITALLLGSFSMGVLHHASRPVLVVHGESPDIAPDAPVLLCYDGSDNAKQALVSAGELFPDRAALVLHVWEPLSSVASVPRIPGLQAALVEGLSEMDRTGAELSEKLAEEGVQLASEAGFQAEGFSEQRDGRAWRAILAVARERGVAAVVVGRRGASAVELAVMGSVSNAVAQHADRPVLVVPGGR